MNHKGHHEHKDNVWPYSLVFLVSFVVKVLHACPP
jgi:hypothetical protein